MNGEVFWTVIGGVAVFVLGQWVQGFILDPIKEFKATLARVSHLLLVKQAKITNASNEEPQLQDEIKALAATLISTAGQIPFYRFWELPPFRLPPRRAVTEAAQELNGIAHGTGPIGRVPDSAIENTKALHKIARLLGIETTYYDRGDDTP